MKRLIFTLVLVLTIFLTFTANATQLPSGIISYVHEKDAKVQIRFDGVIIFSNGETYLPIIPQDTTINPDPQKVVKTIPANTAYPDLIQFDNNFFLLRMIQTASGRITVPKIADYPFAIKEGLLPQDLVVPSNLFIPEELKVILGELPYNPAPDKASVNTTAAKTLGSVKSINPATGQVIQASAADNHPTSLFAYSIDDQTLMSVDPDTGKTTGKIEIGCVPSTMKPSLDGKYLYVGCLSNNEIAVIDTNASLIKARVPLGERPTDMKVIPNTHWLVVSHKFSNHLTLVNTETLLPPDASQRIPVPGKPGAITAISPSEILVADAYDGNLYDISLSSMAIQRTIPTGMKDLSAVWVVTQDQRRPEVWVSSRSENKLQLIDLVTATPVFNQTIGDKPTEMQVMGDKLYVLCSGAARIEVIDMPHRGIVEPIPLQPNSFPVTLVMNPSLRRGYIGSAGLAGITVIDTSRSSVEKVIATPFRSASVAYCDPDGATPDDETNTASEHKLPERMQNFVPGPNEDEIKADESKTDKKPTAIYLAKPNVAKPDAPNTVKLDAAPQSLKKGSEPAQIPTKSMKAEEGKKFKLPLAKEPLATPVSMPAIQENILK